MGDLESWTPVQMEFEGNICPRPRIFGNVFPSAPAVVGSRVLLFHGKNLAVDEEKVSVPGKT